MVVVGVAVGVVVGVAVAVGRPAIAIAGIVVTGVLLAAAARWIRAEGLPDPTSDLDVPALFTGREVGFEELSRTSPEGVPVLCYHYFREGVTPLRMLRVLGAVLLSMPTLPDRDYWTTPLPEFERQMRWLHESGYRTIGLDELSDWMDGRAPRPQRAVVLTVDDGDESFVRLAAPVLRRYGFQATLFFLTGRAGEEGWNDLNFSDWPELRALEREGIVRVESHTHDMHTKVRVDGQPVPRFLIACRDADGRLSPDSPLAQDLVASRDAIRTHLGREARYLAWPFGFGEAAADSIAHAVGFRRILTLRPRRNVRDFRAPLQGEAPDGLGRYTITARTSFRLFRLMVEGGGAPRTRPTA